MCPSSRDELVEETAVNTHQVHIARADIGSDAAVALIRALNRELSFRYQEVGANHFRLDSEEVAEGRGAFVIAYADGIPAGCGAIRLLDRDTAEIKRMYVKPTVRGRGVARRVLASLEAEARSLGVKRVVLETGERQPEALALYSHSGFSRIPAFGEYLGSPLSLCMGKEL